MNKIILLLIVLSSTFTMMAHDNNPVANPKAIVRSGDMRFTVLTPEMIRIEWSAKHIYEDRASFSVINRNLPVPNFTTEEKDGFLFIKTDALTLKYRIGSFPGTFNPASPENLSVTFRMNGREVQWYPWKKDYRNLKGTCRTLDSSNGDNKMVEMEDGLLSRSGWAVIDDTHSVRRADGSRSLMLDRDKGERISWVKEQQDTTAMDWYFMGYGHNYKKALRDFTRIAGKVPMPPRYAFGYWYSKYQRYTSQDFMDLVTDMEHNDIPLDVMVIDTDWHINGWTGWSWNKELIPDPKGLIDYMHKRDIKVTLNLHPAYGVESNEDNFKLLAKDMNIPDSTKNIPWTLENYTFYKSMFDNIIRLREKEGVDFWWLDWQQWLTNKNMPDLSETFWCNHVFYEDMRYSRPQCRPIIFHRWGGLGSHRYQLGFSGDSHSNFPTLAFQPYFTATASNVGYGYWGHDLGGHVQPGDNNPELFLRWIQFGVFTPIFRTHSTNAENIERRMWKYPNFNLMKEAVDLRYSLFPYIYTAAHKAYDTGICICRPLYYEDGDYAESYEHDDEYMFGDDILVAPITEPANATGISEKTIWLPRGEWWDVNNSIILQGDSSYVQHFTQAQIPYFYKSGSLIINYPKVKNLKSTPDHLIVKVVPGAHGEASLYEDEGDNENYKKGKFTTTKLTQNTNGKSVNITIAAREGSFDGMLTHRDYQFQFLGSKMPKSVMINGKPYKQSLTDAPNSWRYDKATKTTYLHLHSVKCEDTTQMKISF